MNQSQGLYSVIYNNNNAFYLKAPFKALKEPAHNNSSTTMRKHFNAKSLL